LKTASTVGAQPEDPEHQRAGALDLFITRLLPLFDVYPRRARTRSQAFAAQARL
jgi:hypothetical protein